MRRLTSPLRTLLMLHREQRLDAMTMLMRRELPAPGDAWNPDRLARKVAELALDCADRTR